MTIRRKISHYPGSEITVSPQFLHRCLTRPGLMNITDLTFDTCEMTEIPEQLSNLSTLEYLTLRRNKISALPETFHKLRNLRRVEIESNNFTEIPRVLLGMKSLICLNMNDNPICRVEYFPPEWEGMRSLSLTGAQLEAVPPTISNLRRLQCLNLSNNQLTKLPESIGQITNLTYFAVRDNKLTSLPKTLVKCLAMKSLNAECNLLTSLPCGWTKENNLHVVIVSLNQLTAIPRSFANIDSLRLLDLTDNQVMFLPPQVGTCNTHIYVDRNPLLTQPVIPVKPQVPRSLLEIAAASCLKSGRSQHLKEGELPRELLRLLQEFAVDCDTPNCGGRFLASAAVRQVTMNVDFRVIGSNSNNQVPVESLLCAFGCSQRSPAQPVYLHYI